VKDYITGIFLIVEDQFGIGDIVTIGEVTGTVEDITLRVTRIRDMSGMVWYVRNGEIVNVGNLSQGHSTGLIDIPVAYDADANKAIAVLREVVAEVDADEAWKPNLIEAPTVVGVDAITGGTMTLRIVVKSPPNQQYAVSREIRERAQIALVKAGIPGPKVIPGI
jgi:small conductance mechanosensitive channel